MGMIDNMMLKSYGSGHSPIADRPRTASLGRRNQKIARRRYAVCLHSRFPPFRRKRAEGALSGLRDCSQPSVLMTAYAVRGLDINTSYTIYHLLNEQKQKGVAILYVGEDLDVLIDLCDRVLVLCGGRNNGIVEGRKTSKEEVGLLMAKLREPQQKMEASPDAKQEHPRAVYPRC